MQKPTKAQIAGQNATNFAQFLKEARKATTDLKDVYYEKSSGMWIIEWDGRDNDECALFAGVMGALIVQQIKDVADVFKKF